MPHVFVQSKLIGSRVNPIIIHVHIILLFKQQQRPDSLEEEECLPESLGLTRRELATAN